MSSERREARPYFIFSMPVEGARSLSWCDVSDSGASIVGACTPTRPRRARLLLAGAAASGTLAGALAGAPAASAALAGRLPVAGIGESGASEPSAVCVSVSSSS